MYMHSPHARLMEWSHVWRSIQSQCPAHSAELSFPKATTPPQQPFPDLYRESVIALDCVQAADPSSSAPTPEDPVDAVFSLFTRFGNSDYIGEPVSSEEHALQVGR